MADAKISTLSSLTTPDGADLIDVVDVDDTTMAASGTNKKTTVAALASGRELGYVDGTGTQSTTSTATDGEAFSPAFSVTVTVGSRPIVVEAVSEYSSSNTSTAQAFLVLMQDGVNIGNSYFRASAINDFGLILLRRRLSLTAGTYTFSLNKRASSGTASYANFGYKIMLHVREV